jgi:hypothetical protein
VEAAADHATVAAGPRRALAALLLFTLLAVAHTWPLASAPADYSRHDTSDPVLNEWVIAWVAHQLPRDPLHLFDANIFHPESNTLAFSEHMFVQGVLGAPLIWIGVPTIAVHNVLILAGLVLSGWTMCLVMYRWTGDPWAAVLSGMLLAFNAHSLGRLSHLQALHVEFLPIAVYALDRLLVTARLRYALLLAIAYAAQSLTSNYLLVFTTFALVAAATVRPGEWLTRAAARTGLLLVLAAAIGSALLIPFLLPYLQASRDQGLTRSLVEVAKYSGSWQDYLAASSRLHYGLWSFQFWRGGGVPLFPGIVAAGLTVVALASGAALSRPARPWLALGIVGCVLSFGTSLPGYATLYELIPLLQGIRASVRFGFLFLVAVAALAGFGLVFLRRRIPTDRGRLAASLAALLLVTVEAARAPMSFTPPHRTPSLYKMFATEADANAVVELPFFSPSQFHLNVHYMLHSTLHWRPLLNGYSGFLPQSYREHYQELRTFPDRRAIAALREWGVTHVVVHESAFVSEVGQERFEQIGETRELLLMLEAGNLRVYRLNTLGS